MLSIILPLSVFLMSCSNSNPNVEFLSAPAVSTPKLQSKMFVDANLAGAQRLSTGDNFKATVVLHGAGPIGNIKTADQYQMTLRQVSFE